jgi:hypothetical protein
MTSDFKRASQWPPVRPPSWMITDTSIMDQLANQSWPYDASRRIHKVRCRQLLQTIQEQVGMTLPSPNTAFYYLAAIYAILTDSQLHEVPVPPVFILYVSRIYLTRMEIASDRSKPICVDAELTYVRDILDLLIKNQTAQTMPLHTFDHMAGFIRELNSKIDTVDFVAESVTKKRKHDSDEKDTFQQQQQRLSVTGRHVKFLVTRWISLMNAHVKRHAKQCPGLLRRLFREQDLLSVFLMNVKLVAQQVRSDAIQDAAETLLRSTLEGWDTLAFDAQSICDFDLHTWIQRAYSFTGVNMCVDMETDSKLDNGDKQDIRSKTETESEISPVSGQVTKRRLILHDDSPKQKPLIQEQVICESSLPLAHESSLPLTRESSRVDSRRFAFVEIDPITHFPSNADEFFRILRSEYVGKTIITNPSLLIRSPDKIDGYLQDIVWLQNCSQLPDKTVVLPGSLHAQAYQYNPTVWNYLVCAAWYTLKQILDDQPTESSTRVLRLKSILDAMQHMTMHPFRFSLHPMCYVEGGHAIRSCMAVLSLLVRRLQDNNTPINVNVKDCWIKLAWTILDVSLRPIVMDLMMKKKSPRGVEVDIHNWMWHMVTKEDVVDGWSTEDKLPTLMKHIPFRWVRWCLTNANVQILTTFLSCASSESTSTSAFVSTLKLWLELGMDYGMRNTQYMQRICMYLASPQTLQYPISILDMTNPGKYESQIDEKTHILHEHIVTTILCEDGSTHTIHVPVDVWKSWQGMCVEKQSFRMIR